MTDDNDQARGARLAIARSKRYASATEAARALGIPPATYAQHENGLRGFKRVAERYADFFRVSLEWLLTGRGEMARSNGISSSIVEPRPEERQDARDRALRDGMAALLQAAGVAAPVSRQLTDTLFLAVDNPEMFGLESSRQRPDRREAPPLPPSRPKRAQ